MIVILIPIFYKTVKKTKKKNKVKKFLFIK